MVQRTDEGHPTYTLHLMTRTSFVLHYTLPPPIPYTLWGLIARKSHNHSPVFWQGVEELSPKLLEGWEV